MSEITRLTCFSFQTGDKSGDYSEIRESSNTRILSNNSLLLQNVKENMEGFYLCQASNGIGNAIGKVIQLKVRCEFEYEILQ